jgi:hypothetical protein
VLVRHGLAGSIQLEEGSGISGGNRFTARGLAQVLQSSNCMPPCSAPARAPGSRLAFSSVSTLAGDADTSKHGRVRFVIALTSNDGAMQFRATQSHPVRAVAGSSAADRSSPTSGWIIIVRLAPISAVRIDVPVACKLPFPRRSRGMGDLMCPGRASCRNQSACWQVSSWRASVRVAYRVHVF